MWLGMGTVAYWHTSRASNTDHVWQYRYFSIGKKQYRYTGIDTGILLNFREGRPGRRHGQNEPARNNPAVRWSGLPAVREISAHRSP